MSADPDTAVLPLGGMEIHDDFIPPLTDGTYQVRVAQTVSAAPVGEPALERTESFTVRGARWVLDPAEVHAQYPPPHASGQFDRILPHVVFTQRALPWERRLNEVPAPSPRERLDEAPERAPWMALLVLEPGELGGEPGPAGLYACTGTVAQLLDDGPDVRAPAVRGTTDQERGAECRWIELPAATFREVMPRLAELRWLAHCRRVNTADKPALSLRDEGWFSVVVAGRFPAAPTQGAGSALAIAHLVSLEGVEELLVEGAALPPAARGGEKAVRMVSLLSWSFETVGEPGSSFHALAGGLAGPGEADPGALMLRRTVAAPVENVARPAAAPAEDEAHPAALAAKARLREGYAALEYRARTGDLAFAWYRGPLAPVIPARLERDAPFPSASAAVVWDGTTGTFDHSLSAAWSLGRALALADADFALRMLSLHRRAHALADGLLAPLQPSTPPMPDQAGVTEPGPGEDRVARLLATGIADAADAGAEGAAAPVAADRPAPAQVLRELLARDGVRQSIRAHAGPDLDAVARWLGRLCLLEGVPFPHLVPDPAVLPPESLRFFYLDRNWIEAAVDGAISVGANTGRDRMVTDALYADVRDAALRAAVAGRAAPLCADAPSSTGAPSSTDATPSADATPSTDAPPSVVAPSGAALAVFPPACAGLLLRSALVSGWPGLSVRGFQGGEPLPVLRMERLSGSVLLCLWAGMPDRVELAEPQEALRFGISGDGTVQPRSVADSVGRQLDGSPIVLRTPEMLRPGRALNLRPATGTGLLAALAIALERTSPAPSFADPRLSPAEFAVQMLHAPARLSFPPAAD